MDEWFAVTVLYRSGTEIFEVSAKMDQDTIESVGSDGSVIESKSRAFIIATNAECFTYGNTQPRRGDQIELTIDDVVHVFEALADPDGNVWQFYNAHQTHYKINTVRRESS